MEHNSFHKIILKNTGLFGVSQVLKIVSRIITNKAAAIFIGPVGIGMVGLLDNIIALIQGFTNFGIAQSNVREIALVSTEGIADEKKETRLVKIAYHWAICTGILGAIVFLIFSSYINLEVFGSKNLNVWVIILCLYFVFSAITSIRLAVLQAKKNIKAIVNFHVVSAVLTSILSVGLYYLKGQEGIIPVFLSSSIIQCLCSIYLTKKFNLKSENVTLTESFKEGLPMAQIGLLLSVSVILGQLCFYIIRWFLKTHASFDALGVYQVSNTFLVGYLGLVFSAMANDYYPRLCNYDKDEEQFSGLINDQTESALLIVVPAILLMYAFAPQLVTLLYSNEFLDVLMILKIGLVAVILKAMVWPIGFISLIKGNKLLYLKQNVLGDVVNVAASLLFFYYYGYVGLGCAMVTMFTISFAYTYYTVKKKYNFKYRPNTIKVILTSCAICLVALILIFYFGFLTVNVPFYALVSISGFYSLRHFKKALF